MTERKHPEFESEEARLSFTRDYMRMTIHATEQYKALYGRNVKEAMADLDVLDGSQSYISIMLNTRYMEMAEKNYLSLTRSYDKPYFARIDFRADGSEKIEQMYIGKTSLMKEDDDLPIIVDWRAPIASVYYEGRLGETTYDSQGETYGGELLLKRQYEIEKGVLKRYMDIDIATNDALLQASLNAGADNRLKDIATTIQAEQNRVIRADMRKPLIVQGVAGSGKTTIALHRIAYFIYTYQDIIRPEAFMIMAPNHLFLNYISQVLPELGVEKVVQTTFEAFFRGCTGLRMKIEPPMKKLTTYFERGYDTALSVSKYKGKLAYKAHVEAYFKACEAAFLPTVPFVYEGHVLMSAGEMRKLLREDLGHLPLYRRLKTLEKTLKIRTQQQFERLRKRAVTHYDGTIEHLLRTLPPDEQRREKVVALMDEKASRLQKLDADVKTLVKVYMQAFEKIKLFDHYRAFATFLQSVPSAPEAVGAHLEAQLKARQLEKEDMAALILLKALFFGVDGASDIKTIVIDEAQDFSPFEVAVIQNVCKTEMLTLLGDVSQGIHAYRSMDSWGELIGEVFREDHVTYLTLEQSYRTTVEIMAVANHIIGKWENAEKVLAKPVIRHGEKPVIESHASEQALYDALENGLAEGVDAGYQSIALILKTENECKKVLQALKKRKQYAPKMLKGDESEYEAGMVILPAYIAKGLEFDAVFIVSLEEAYTLDALDVKMLYVASTRAMHHMAIHALSSVFPEPLKTYRTT